MEAKGRIAKALVGRRSTVQRSSEEYAVDARQTRARGSPTVRVEGREDGLSRIRSERVSRCSKTRESTGSPLTRLRGRRR